VSCVAASCRCASHLCPASDLGADAGFNQPASRDRGAGAWEPKWDGWRVLLWGEAGQLRAITRAGHDVTRLFPEFEPLGGILGHRKAILDGELVAWGDDGRPDFGRLFSRFRGRWSRSRQTKAEAPVTWVAFDVCYLDGASFLSQPYRVRRAALEVLRAASGDMAVELLSP
jgi:bifunctional non-homologous end joining protein LigD